MKKQKSIFISYSWDNEEHKKWVLNLALNLLKDGHKVYLDQLDLKPGMDIPKYVETCIRESDHILLICTPLFKEKADKSIGGAGYEKNIITGEMVHDSITETKFIPLLKSENSSDSLPSYLKSKYYVDFGKGKEKSAYSELSISLDADSDKKYKKIVPLNGERNKKTMFISGLSILIFTAGIYFSYYALTTNMIDRIIIYPKRNIPERILQKYPEIYDLIVKSDSLNKDEKGYWIKLLRGLPMEQVGKLHTILSEEREKLKKVDEEFLGEKLPENYDLLGGRGSHK